MHMPDLNVRRNHPFAPRAFHLTRRSDGTVLLEGSSVPEQAEASLPAILARQATANPRRPWLAQRRGPHAAWSRLHYGEAKAQVDAIAQRLLDMACPGRCVVVLSENSLEHAVLGMAAMQSGMPYVPISPAYALMTSDRSKLQSMLDLVQPAVVFVQDVARFGPALQALRLPADAVCLAVEPHATAPGIARWQDWLSTPPGPGVAEALEGLAPHGIAKYLFTSGSTGLPKAAAITHGMLTVSIRMHEMLEDVSSLPPPEILDWLPWSHVASGNVLFGRILSAGGTVWIDDGKPLPGRFEATLRNLMEVSPTEYASVPLGYALLVEALERDQALAERFFSRLQKLSYAGARLPDSIIERMQAVAIRTLGKQVPFISGFGSTETSATVTMSAWNHAQPGSIGLPHPGVRLKLVPLDDDRYELRVHSPVLTPGYLHNPQATAAAFDAEGWFLMGDAVRFVDPAHLDEGLAFAGRVAEEFKLQSGVFVRVGALRVDVLEAAGGLLTDAVVTGADEAFVGLMAWPNLTACRALLQRPDATLAEAIASPVLRDALRTAMQAHNLRSGGSSRSIHRLLLLADPPDLGAGELTDKGYINQRLVQQRRAADVRRVHAALPDPAVISID